MYLKVVVVVEVVVQSTLDSVTLQGHATSRNTLNVNHKRKRKTVQKEKEDNKNERRIFPVR